MYTNSKKLNSKFCVCLCVCVYVCVWLYGHVHKYSVYKHKMYTKHCIIIYISTHQQKQLTLYRTSSCDSSFKAVKSLFISVRWAQPNSFLWALPAEWWANTKLACTWGIISLGMEIYKTHYNVYVILCTNELNCQLASIYKNKNIWLIQLWCISVAAKCWVYI